MKNKINDNILIQTTAINKTIDQTSKSRLIYFLYETILYESFMLKI